jgi:porphobilinogen synthase
MSPAAYPALRMRRTRAAAWSRALHAETVLTPSDLIWPLFVTDGAGVEEPIATLPGVSRWSVDRIGAQAKLAHDLGIPCVALFPNTPPGLRSEDAAEALNSDNLICRAIKAAKEAAPEVGVLTDVALDPYTAHGHDGLTDEAGYVVNDATVKVLVRQALVQAAAGADIVAPSDMMDGRVGAIRQALDERSFDNVAIMSYAAKYCSAFYGPFREAAASAPQFGDRRSHQMDPANALEALREVEQDIEEGADIVMVKPAMPYLDVVTRVKERFQYPTAAYQVSGEYAMLKAAARNGWIDERRAMLESLTAIHRAGADIIITYYAREAARALR